MLFNRTFWVLIIVLAASTALFVFAVPSGSPVITGSSRKGFDSYTKEVSGSWDKMTDKYGGPKAFEADLFLPVLVGMAGFGVVFGTNFWMKRRNRDAIERFFSHFKNKR